MTSNAQSDSTNPFFVWQSWLKEIQSSAAGLPAPSASLEQSILPGWTFGNVVINEQNSSDPQAEQNIVSQYSYGKQLGWLTEAVGLLLDKLPNGALKGADLDKAKHIKELIEKAELAKSNAKASRLARIKDDLAWLKKNKPKEYQALFDTLKP